MDEKLGSRQYAELEPSQKIFNTLIMTLGSELLIKNINNSDELKRIVRLSVMLADELVELLYNKEGLN